MNYFTLAFFDFMPKNFSECITFKGKKKKKQIFIKQNTFFLHTKSFKTNIPMKIMPIKSINLFKN